MSINIDVGFGLRAVEYFPLAHGEQFADPAADSLRRGVAPLEEELPRAAGREGE